MKLPFGSFRHIAHEAATDLASVASWVKFVGYTLLTVGPQFDPTITHAEKPIALKVALGLCGLDILSTVVHRGDH